MGVRPQQQVYLSLLVVALSLLSLSALSPLSVPLPPNPRNTLYARYDLPFRARPYLLSFIIMRWNLGPIRITDQKKIILFCFFLRRDSVQSRASVNDNVLFRTFVWSCFDAPTPGQVGLRQQGMNCGAAVTSAGVVRHRKAPWPR